MIFSFSTITLPAPRSTERTFPDFPRSRPEITTTVSPFRILLLRSACTVSPTHSPLQHLRRQGNDLHEFLPTQFTRDRTKNTGSNRLPVFIDQDTGVPIELNI